MPAWSIWVIGAVVVIADRLSKLAVMKHMTEFQSTPVIPHVLWLTYVQNTGAAFSLFQRGTIILAAVSAVVVVAVVWASRHPLARGPWIRVALGLVLGGALGNLYDRMFYRSVVDFLDVRIWPVFNVADSSIVVGGVLVFFLVLFDPAFSGKATAGTGNGPGAGAGAGAGTGAETGAETRTGDAVGSGRGEEKA